MVAAHPALLTRYNTTTSIITHLGWAVNHKGESWEESITEENMSGWLSLMTNMSCLYTSQIRQGNWQSLSEARKTTSGRAISITSRETRRRAGIEGWSCERNVEAEKRTKRSRVVFLPSMAELLGDTHGNSSVPLHKRRAKGNGGMDDGSR